VTRVVAGFFSFTEVEAGEHQSYNEWHLFDHQPEQYTLPGIAWGQRWVLPPALGSFAAASEPLDRTHYVTLYLLAEPLEQTLADFMALGRRLAAVDRFHLHRTSHLAGPLPVAGTHAAPHALVAPEAIPFRPGTGLHVRVVPDDAEGGRPEALVDVPGVAGVWTFGGPSATGPLAGLRVVCCWLDGDPATAAAAIGEVAPPPPEDAPTRFTATLTTVDPHGPWDWFDR
jgi:hypothetical protein